MTEELVKEEILVKNANKSIRYAIPLIFVNQ